MSLLLDNFPAHLSEPGTGAGVVLLHGQEGSCGVLGEERRDKVNVVAKEFRVQCIGALLLQVCSSRIQH